MPRIARVAPGGLAYHVLNLAVARLPLFEKEGDYLAFEKVLEEAQERHPTRILAYCLLPNHWHFVVWPREDGELTAFFPLADAHPYHAFARASPHIRGRALVSRPLQVVSGRRKKSCEKG